MDTIIFVAVLLIIILLAIIGAFEGRLSVIEAKIKRLEKIVIGNNEDDYL